MDVGCVVCSVDVVDDVTLRRGQEMGPEENNHTYIALNAHMSADAISDRPVHGI